MILYIRTIHDKHRAIWQTRYTRAVRKYHDADQAGARRAALLWFRYSKCLYTRLHDDPGKFDDSYSPYSVMRQLGISSHDVEPLCDNGLLDTAAIRRLYDMVYHATIPNRPTSEGSPPYPFRNWYAYHTERRTVLLLFLLRALNRQEPVYCLP